MGASFSLKKQENFNCSSRFSIQNYCELYAKQLIYHYPIYCLRIIYYQPASNKYQEVLQYAENQLAISPQDLAYLRSESWLKHFPHVFEVHELNLVKLPQYFSYICIISYNNHQMEYIQVITDEPLSLKLQNKLQESAIILSEYTKLNLENLHQGDKIQLLEQILHKAGHQLRNSLALIGLYAHNLYLRSPDNGFQKEAKVIHDSVQDLNSNLTEILSCTQGVKLSIVSQDLKKIVAESIEYLQPLIDQKHLKINLPDTSTIISLDILQIKQVFDNLIINAIHFSPDFGTITFSWQIFQEEVLIKISDQGTGILPEDISKIFNPFYSRRSGGTGLGLTIAKKIVLDHHGNIWAQNLPQGGAIFSIILPRK
ncbi:sensor histidine kinase [Nostoc sphaeroides]|uniref:histidine kinase n=1 Tax=Nostoc sphaeroides CCNUC1 TaxID=2653204 RepID=A0A5P8WBU0_9NOSO|nr:HAMP domain-containing sensor histidine kinase [Nostoc sphaeroides]QFS50273.1 ATP-binding protein [Nostoc sphaeroides CCNUC1]